MVRFLQLNEIVGTLTHFTVNEAFYFTQSNGNQVQVSTSDSLRPWRYINILTYLLTYLLDDN